MDRFSLGGVASELGVSAPSLYRVVESRSALVDLCLDRAAEGLTPPDPSMPWQAQLRNYVDEMWELLEGFPGLGRVILDRPGAHVAVQGYFRALAESVAEASFPGDTELLDFVLDFLGDTTLITHLGIENMRRKFDGDRTGLDEAMRKLEAEAESSGGRTHIAADDSWLVRGFLDSKVDFIIAGVEVGLGPGRLDSVT